MALNCIEICMQINLSHHESVVITLIKGTLEDLTRAVADKKLVVSVIITVTVIYFKKIITKFLY